VTSLHTHVYGDPAGAPVIAIHGVQAHGERWRRLAEERLATRHVLAPDLRGHGRSPSVPPWGLEQHVADLLALADAAELDTFDVVGHSFGGLLALHLAAAAPGRARRVVLLDPAIALDPATALASAEDARVDEGWGTEQEARAARLEGHPAEATPMVDEDLAQALERGHDGRLRLRWARPAAVAAWGEMARPMPVITVLPTLLVWATQAAYVRPHILDRLREALGDALDVRAVDAGHSLLWDAYAETADAVTAFLAT
jgi:lipase